MVHRAERIFMKRKIWIMYASFAVFVVVGIPFLIDWIIIGNQFPSHIQNSEWVSFFGGYIGAIIGGVISLLGIYFTIRFTQNQNRIDRELQIRPYFDIECKTTNEFPDAWKGNVQIITHDKCNYLCNAIGSAYLYFKNVGNGSAINVDFKVEIGEVSFYHQEHYNNLSLMIAGYSVSPNEKAGISINIICNDQAVLMEYEGLQNNEIDLLSKSAPDSFKFVLLMSYSDLLDDCFKQELKFSVDYIFCQIDEEKYKYRCNINLIEIGIPKMASSIGKKGE